MEALSHDPKIKQQIKDALYEFLYGPLQLSFKQHLDAIVLKCAKALNSQYLSFTYKGEVFALEGEKLPRRMNRLPDHLHSEMDSYLHDLAEVNEKEVPYVLGFITQTLNASNDLHDYFRVLPSAVHGPIQDLINSCPYRTKRLTDESVQDLLIRNAKSIHLTKCRMVQNLIL